MVKLCWDYDYSGSQAFGRLMADIGLSNHEINLFVCLLLVLILGYPNRWILQRPSVPAEIRMLFEFGASLVVIYIMFGWLLIHPLLLTFLGYAIFQATPTIHLLKTSIIASFGYLASVHIYRQTYRYMECALYIDMALMINVQKITSLAASYQDGHRKNNDAMSQIQKKYSISRVPSFLEYFSYALNYTSCLVGPFCFFKEYQTHIKLQHSDKSHFNHQSIIFKCLLAIMFGVAATFMRSLGPSETIIPFMCSDCHILYKYVLMFIFTLTTRFGYFTAWLLASAAAENSGLRAANIPDVLISDCETITSDHSVKDRNGNRAANDSQRNVTMSARFHESPYGDDITKIVSIPDIEFGWIRTSVNNWNLPVLRWLRHLVYSRTRSMALTMIVSCLWHGFYPGYFLMFTQITIILLANRFIQRKLTPYLLFNKRLFQFCVALAYIVNRVAFSYASFPFMLHDVEKSLLLYTSLRFGGHIVFLMVLFIAFCVPDLKDKSS